MQETKECVAASLLDEIQGMSDEELEKCFGTSDMETLSRKSADWLEEKLSAWAAEIASRTDVRQAEMTLPMFLRQVRTYTEEEAVRAAATNSPNLGMLVRLDRARDGGSGVILKRGKTLYKVYFSVDAGSISRMDLISLRLGDIVTFVPAVDDSGMVFAADVTRKHGVHRGILDLENGNRRINLGNVIRYGKCNALRRIARDTGFTPKDVLRRGYRFSDFDYVYIRTPYTEYRIFQDGTPISGDCRTKDLNAFLACLDKRIFGFDMESILKRADDAEMKRLATVKREEEKQKVHGYCRYKMFAAFDTLGFSHKSAKELMRRNGFEKQFKRGYICSGSDFLQIAALWGKKEKPSVKPGENAAKYETVAILIGNGVSQKEARNLAWNAGAIKDPEAQAFRLLEERGIAPDAEYTGQI